MPGKVAVDRHAINAISETHKPGSAAHLKPGHPAGTARPWPSVERRRSAPTVQTVHTDRPSSPDARPLYVRGHRDTAVHSATR
jgi:hypothetical protein